MVFSCFAVFVLANNARVVPYFYRRVWLKIWYNPCIIRQYIHGKTDENHVLFCKCRILGSTLMHGWVHVAVEYYKCVTQGLFN